MSLLILNIFLILTTRDITLILQGPARLPFWNSRSRFCGYETPLKLGHIRTIHAA